MSMTQSAILEQLKKIQQGCEPSQSTEESGEEREESTSSQSGTNILGLRKLSMPFFEFSTATGSVSASPDSTPQPSPRASPRSSLSVSLEPSETIGTLALVPASSLSSPDAPPPPPPPPGPPPSFSFAPMPTISNIRLQRNSVSVVDPLQLQGNYPQLTKDMVANLKRQVAGWSQALLKNSVPLVGALKQKREESMGRGLDLQKSMEQADYKLLRAKLQDILLESPRDHLVFLLERRDFISQELYQKKAMMGELYHQLLADSQKGQFLAPDNLEKLHELHRLVESINEDLNKPDLQQLDAELECRITALFDGKLWSGLFALAVGSPEFDVLVSCFEGHAQMITVATKNIKAGQISGLAVNKERRKLEWKPQSVSAEAVDLRKRIVYLEKQDSNLKFTFVQADDNVLEGLITGINLPADAEPQLTPDLTAKIEAELLKDQRYHNYCKAPTARQGADIKQLIFQGASALRDIELLQERISNTELMRHRFRERIASVTSNDATTSRSLQYKIEQCGLDIIGKNIVRNKTKFQKTTDQVKKMAAEHSAKVLMHVAEGPDRDKRLSERSEQLMSDSAENIRDLLSNLQGAQIKVEDLIAWFERAELSLSEQARKNLQVITQYAIGGNSLVPYLNRRLDGDSKNIISTLTKARGCLQLVYGLKTTLIRKQENQANTNDSNKSSADKKTLREEREQELAEQYIEYSIIVDPSQCIYTQSEIDRLKVSFLGVEDDMEDAELEEYLRQKLKPLENANTPKPPIGNKAFQTLLRNNLPNVSLDRYRQIIGYIFGYDIMDVRKPDHRSYASRQALFMGDREVRVAEFERKKQLEKLVGELSQKVARLKDRKENVKRAEEEVEHEKADLKKMIDRAKDINNHATVASPSGSSSAGFNSPTTAILNTEIALADGVFTGAISIEQYQQSHAELNKQLSKVQAEKKHADDVLEQIKRDYKQACLVNVEYKRQAEELSLKSQQDEEKKRQLTEQAAAIQAQLTATSASTQQQLHEIRRQADLEKLQLIQQLEEEKRKAVEEARAAELLKMEENKRKSVKEALGW